LLFSLKARKGEEKEERKERKKRKKEGGKIDGLEAREETTKQERHRAVSTASKTNTQHETQNTKHQTVSEYLTSLAP
jgi:hypothetical protein